MKHYLKIKINTKDKSKVLLKLNNIGVDIKNIEYLREALVCDILSNDLKRVKKYLFSYKLEIIDDKGFYKLIKELKKNILLVVGLVFSVLIFLILTNIIVKVNVIHQDKEIRQILTDALEEAGVKPLSFKKSYQEYEQIITNIKNNYKDKIEWLEIEVKGMVINVRVEKRIITNQTVPKDYCHIVAKKSGIVKKILTRKGVALVSINDYVNKDDILISGEIKVGEEVKDNVCSDGEVMGEVWYKASANIPLEYQEANKTGKWRFNFLVNDGLKDTLILKRRIKDSEIEKKELFKVLGYTFYIAKEYEVKRETKSYSTNEAINKATEEIFAKLKLKSQDTDKIISQKVLQKSVNNGNLYIEMFFSIEEQIGEVKEYTLEMEDDRVDKVNN